MNKYNSNPAIGFMHQRLNLISIAIHPIPISTPRLFFFFLLL
jgi:hypothetical protein